MIVGAKVLTYAEVPAVKAKLLAAVDAGETVLDFTGLERADSAALSALLSAKRRANARGAALALRGLPAQLRELARLYGVEAFLGDVEYAGSAA